jgi:hypothetical protein
VARNLYLSEKVLFQARFGRRLVHKDESSLCLDEGRKKVFILSENDVCGSRLTLFDAFNLLEEPMR